MQIMNFVWISLIWETVLGQFRLLQLVIEIYFRIQFLHTRFLELREKCLEQSKILELFKHLKNKKALSFYKNHYKIKKKFSLRIILELSKLFLEKRKIKTSLIFQETSQLCCWWLLIIYAVIPSEYN